MSNAATPTDATPVDPAGSVSPGATGTTSTSNTPSTKKPAAKKPAQPKTSTTKSAAAKSSSAKSAGKSGGGQGAGKKGAQQAPEARSAAQIQADIDAAQARLASRVDELSDRLSPQHLADEAVGGVKRVFVNDDGSPKVKPLAMVAGGLTALVVLRKIFHR